TERIPVREVNRIRARGGQFIAGRTLAPLLPDFTVSTMRFLVSSPRRWFSSSSFGSARAGYGRSTGGSSRR
ncbi:MAG: hypothetical protein ABW110_03285, partial [Steroidobacteraceae bacterium]